MQIGLNTLGLTGSSNPFSPTSLFLNGEQGGWYDPSDLSTMYQDDAGTTPAAVNQPVGLRLDKSLGAVRGAELWDDALTTFLGSGGKVSTGVYRIFTPDGTIAQVACGANLTIGEWYEVTFNVDSVAVAGSGSFAVGNALEVVLPLTVGAKRCIFRNTTSTPPVIKRSGGVAQDFQVSNVSWKSLSGNHATQATSTSRPLWKQDANGFLHEEFDGADDYLTSATGGGGSAGFFYCAAIYVGGGAGTNRTLWSDQSGNTGVRVRIDSAGAFQMIAGNGTALVNASTPAGQVSDGSAYVLTAWYDGTNAQVQVNSGAVASTALAALAAGTAGFTEGRDNGISTGYFPGRIYTSVYRKDSAPDAATRELVKRRIAAKAGISL